MDISRAKEIVNLYGAALARGEEGEVARRQSLLPCDRDSIIKAYKLFIANYIEFDLLDQETGELFLTSLCYIDSFIPDNLARDINIVGELIKSGISQEESKIRDYFEFSTSTFNSELADQINDFIQQVYNLDKSDPLYHQRIYTLAGVEYSPKAKKSLWSKLFSVT